VVSTDPNLHFDYGPLVYLPVHDLLVALAETHSAIANLIIRVGFLRQEELRGTQEAKVMRLEMEALRDAYIEKKWLLVKVLEYRDNG
jgi:hypothetical protein